MGMMHIFPIPARLGAVASKAKGLCPLEPREGLRPWNPFLAVEERGLTTELFQSHWLAPLFDGQQRVLRAQPLGSKPNQV